MPVNQRTAVHYPDCRAVPLLPRYFAALSVYHRPQFATARWPIIPVTVLLSPSPQSLSATYIHPHHPVHAWCRL